LQWRQAGISGFSLKEQAGLLPAGIGHAAASAYRSLRREQHQARRNEESTQVLLSEVQTERGAGLALWKTVFGDVQP
jgi:glutamate-ammonia-ligase adenylyltransferase